MIFLVIEHFCESQHFLTLWPWTGSLAYILNTLPCFKITFEKRVPELWYFTWLFLVTRFVGSIHSDLDIWPIFFNKKLILVIISKNIIYGNIFLIIPYCTWAFLVTRSSFFFSIKILVLMILVIFGRGHYRGLLCFIHIVFTRIKTFGQREIYNV